MKKWHSGVENGEILNPALYKQHHMKTRWSSNSLVQRGRSGALSVTLSAALRVRGKPLNEVGGEAVAVNYQHLSQFLRNIIRHSEEQICFRFCYSDIPLSVLPTRVLRIFKWLGEGM